MITNLNTEFRLHALARVYTNDTVRIGPLNVCTKLYVTGQCCWEVQLDMNISYLVWYLSFTRQHC
jgi:hypothetical protein